ncbi:N-acetylglucosamine-6-phosphate deacetylase [Alteromonas sp. H39]|uniref:N-acetylglucosamine-6-phosphate deacetylase n=1 Tax=Alteromonas sp. H39 TaxID=3389876 RepID=UPI0039DF895B
MIVTGKQVLTPVGFEAYKTLVVEGSCIKDIRDATDKERAGAHDMLIPGFIDVQVNGGGGVLLNQQCTMEAINTMMCAHRHFGTTAMMPTLITDSTETMAAAAQAIIDARSNDIPGIVGVHFEGPWLSTARKGVHSEAFIRPPCDEELAILQNPALGVVMVTVAPENVSPAVIRVLTDAGVKVFLGHSDASAKEVGEALQAGAVGFTHLYNAMSPLQSRAPGMVGTALAHDASYAGIIVDGYHVDPVACQVAFRAKGVDRMMLVTDAMALAATDLQEVPFFDTHIVRDGDKLTTPDGTLAGSCLTMIEALRNTVSECAVPLADAVKMASQTPAEMLGITDRYGKLEAGLSADILALDHSLTLTHVWQQGRLTDTPTE